MVLTSRPVGADERVPLAGVPYHSVDPHIAKLVNAGYKVAIAEQLGSEPPPGEKLVERIVRRVVTAGTVVEPGLLDEGRNNYLAAMAFSAQRADRYGQSLRPRLLNPSIGLAYADITTGEFAATAARRRGGRCACCARSWRVCSRPRCWWRRQGEEGEGSEEGEKEERGCVPARRRCCSGSPRLLSLTALPAWQFELETARQALLEQFEVESLAAFGCEQLPQAVRAAGALVQYLRKTQRGDAAAPERACASTAPTSS